MHVQCVQTTNAKGGDGCWGSNQVMNMHATENVSCPVLMMSVMAGQQPIGSPEAVGSGHADPPQPKRRCCNTEKYEVPKPLIGMPTHAELMADGDKQELHKLRTEAAANCVEHEKNKKYYYDLNEPENMRGSKGNPIALLDSDRSLGSDGNPIVL